MQDRKWLQCPYLLGLQPLFTLSTVKDGIIVHPPGIVKHFIAIVPPLYKPLYKPFMIISPGYCPLAAAVIR